MAMAANPVSSTISGRFPENGYWKGMAIEYTIEGVTSLGGNIDSNKTTGDRSTGVLVRNTRMIDGFLSGKILEVTGTAYANDELPAGGAHGSFYSKYNCTEENGDCKKGGLSAPPWVNGYFDLHPGQSTPFKFSLAVPDPDVFMGVINIESSWNEKGDWPVRPEYLWSMAIDCQFTNQSGTIPPRECDRLILDVNEGSNNAVIAKVVDACKHKPLDNVTLEIRVFHTYDSQKKKAINGQYVDRKPMLTNLNGEAIIPVGGSPGDIYRVDVYASKEGWDKSDRSIHVTIGEKDGSSGNGSGISFNGTWNTTFGTLTLVQEGEHVTGEYSHDNGMIEGTVIGNALLGTWTEAPTRRPPNDAGEMEFQLDSEGRSFVGKWRYDSSGEWKSWNGELIEEKW